jgi:hypothetical protein
MTPDIYSYVKQQENAFESDEAQIGDNWTWNFKKHVQLIFHLKNGVFFTGENNWLRAFKAVMEPVLNLCNWTEDIEVKDITFFIEGMGGKALSFLLKKYHDEVYSREHDLDFLFDEITESDNAYGGVLVQKGAKTPVEVIQLNAIAFCDQTDTLGSPIGFKHYFSPDKIRGMSKMGWGEEKNGATISLEELCVLATAEKDPVGTQNEKKNQVPGKQIEVYVVMGSMPEHYLKNNDNMEDCYEQVQIIAYYTDKDNKKQGVTLYRKKQSESMLKFFTSNPVYQRALGRGVGEALLPSQIWTNFLEVHKMNMLEAASKVPLYTDDESYTTKNKIRDMENLEITRVAEGKSIQQVPTAAPANIQLFSNEINSWYDTAQLQGAAFDPIMGKEQPSGGTFRGQERTVAQGKGLHDRRRGKRAKFIEELYRDWFIPDMVREIIKGKEFLADLSTEELMWVAEEMSTVESNKLIKDMVLYERRAVTPEEQDVITKTFRQKIIKKGNKQMLEILEGEFEGIETRLGINVAGKQKDLATLSDKLLSIFQYVFQNPAGFQQAMQIPALARSFENILEFGGMSIGNFSSLLTAAPAVQSPIQPEAQPQQELLANEQAQ